MTGWEDMSTTPTTTNESAAQGGESQNDRETEAGSLWELIRRPKHQLSTGRLLTSHMSTLQMVTRRL
jgi:hypothetical protein